MKWCSTTVHRELKSLIDLMQRSLAYCYQKCMLSASPLRIQGNHAHVVGIRRLRRRNNFLVSRARLTLGHVVLDGSGKQNRFLKMDETMWREREVRAPRIEHTRQASGGD